MSALNTIEFTSEARATFQRIHQPVNQREHLLAKNPQLKDWVEQGFAPGQIIEWGAPSGHDGRSVILNFLLNPPGRVLWIHSNPKQQPYPPAWAARGAPLDQFYFIHCSEPVRRLRPLFLEKTFAVIVLDAPEKVYKGELAFISQCVRKNHQILFLIRPYFLSPRRGNPFSQQRMNICFDAGQNGYHIRAIRGGNHHPTMTLSKEAFYESF